MECMVCNLVQEVQSSPGRASCCPHCGWPHGSLVLTFEGREVTESDPIPVRIIGQQAATIDVECSNAGHGTLLCETRDLPPGVQLDRTLKDSWDVARGGDPHLIRLHVDPSHVPAGQQEIPIAIWACDAKGHRSSDLRPFALDCAYQPHYLRLVLEATRMGPIHVYSDLLLFKRDKPHRTLKLKNLGQVPLSVNIKASEGYKIRRAGVTAFTTEITDLVVQAEIREDILVSPASNKVFDRGEITVEVPQIGQIHTVQLHPLPEEEVYTPTYRYIVGIDFGTAKTAVCVADGTLPKPEPGFVEWPYSKGDLRPKVDSVIMYPEKGGLPLFGFDVPIGIEEGDLLIRSIKMRLAEDRVYEIPGSGRKAEVLDVVAEYLRFLLRHLEAQDWFADSHDPFSDVLFVMSLPVLDDSVLARRQESLTRQAAIKAGLNAEQVRFFYEPECAAVDYLRNREKWHLGVRNNDLLCVYDCGAGTTDISVLRIHIRGGEVSFTVEARVGFPVGGDLIDQLLVELAADNIGGSAKLEASGATRDQVVAALRPRKETLGFPNPPARNTSVPCDIGRERFDLSSEELDHRFQPYLDMMLDVGCSPDDLEIISLLVAGPNGGIAPDAGLPSLGQVLAERGIAKERVRWVCLTGGSSMMLGTVRTLLSFFPKATLVPSEQQLHQLSKERDCPLTLNVARGAAMRPSFRVEGQLRETYYVTFSSLSDEPLACVSAEFGTSQLQPVIPAGATPGTSSDAIPRVLRPEETVTVNVVAKLGGEEGVVFRERVCNSFPQIAHLRAGLSYGIAARLPDSGPQTVKLDNRLRLRIDLGVESEWKPYLQEVFIDD